jgi:hypothetical protein
LARCWNALKNLRASGIVAACGFVCWQVLVFSLAARCSRLHTIIVPCCTALFF